MLWTIAWRNIWRQKKRTLVTAVSISMALFLSLTTRCLQEGSYALSIDNAARFYTGLIQLQNAEYVDSLSINDVLPGAKEFIDPVLKNSDISFVLPRLESYALAAAGKRSKGAILIGALPDKENEYSSLAEKVIKGEFIRHDDDKILVGEALAKYFQVTVGDELILYGQGYHGQTAAGIFTIKGILRFPLPSIDNQLIYLPLMLAQRFYSTGDNVTCWVLHTKSLNTLKQTVGELRYQYHSSVAVRDWEELSPELAQQITMDKVSGIVIIYLLYGVVGFALFATITMMALERQREFGVMLATGMLRLRLIYMIVIESFFVALLGLLMGLGFAALVLTYLYYNPIQLTGDAARMMIESGFEPLLPVLITPQLVLNQVLSVLLLLALCLIYPLYRVRHLSVVSALKGGAHAG